MLSLVGKCPESIDDVGPVECVKVWRCGIVIPQAPYLCQGEREKLVFGVEGIEVKQMLLLCIGRHYKISIRPWRGRWRGNNLRLGHDDGCFGIHLACVRVLGLCHDCWPLGNGHRVASMPMLLVVEQIATGGSG